MVPYRAKHNIFRIFDHQFCLRSAKKQKAYHWSNFFKNIFAYKSLRAVEKKNNGILMYFQEKNMKNPFFRDYNWSGIKLNISVAIPSQWARTKNVFA